MQYLVMFKVMISAKGMTLIARDIYTAVPGTERAVISPAKQSSLPESYHVLHPPQQAETLALPGGHHDKHTVPRLNGNQPPESSLSRLAVTREYRHKGKQSGSAQQNTYSVPVLTCHGSRENRRQHHGSVTAIPYAAARLLECSKLTITSRPRHRASSSQREYRFALTHFGGVNNAHRRQISQTYRLTVNEKTPEITACEAITVASAA